MNPAQRATLKRLVLWAGLLFVLGLYLLVIELQGASQGGNSTLSELFWLLWAEHPWVVFLVSHLFAAPVWFFSGHWVAQSNSVYDKLRGGL